LHGSVDEPVEPDSLHKISPVEGLEEPEAKAQDYSSKKAEGIPDLEHALK
jgi:hypothetical protein